MRKSRIKSKLSQGHPVLLTQLHLSDPSVYELVSMMGIDGIWIDLEHHAFSVETAGNLMRSARVGTSDIMVRPAKGEFTRMSRLLEGGAQGVMYPRCDDAAEAAEVVKWAKFAPLGKRGFDGGNPDMPYCSMPIDQYVHQANEQTFVAVQLEEQHAIDEAEAIAATEGVDVIYFGPADYSVLNGLAGQFDHPLIGAAIKKVADAARNTGKHWGMPVFSLDAARTMLEMGARFLSYYADILMIKNGLAKILTDFEPLGFSFEGSLQDDNKGFLYSNNDE